MTKIFSKELPDDCEKAINELKKLKVYREMNDDVIDNFADVWFRVQLECDLFEWGEDTNVLTKRSYDGAMRWLNKWKKLYDKYEDK